MEIKDYIYFGGVLVAILSSWFKIKLETEKQEEKISNLAMTVTKHEKELKEVEKEARLGRSEIYKNFEVNLKSNNEVFSKQFKGIDTEIRGLQQSFNAINLSIQDLTTKMELLINKLEL